jgi:hypothetical protein
MSEGRMSISKVMEKIKSHLKPNTDKEHHYNRVYEILMKFQDEIEDSTYQEVQDED